MNKARPVRLSVYSRDNFALRRFLTRVSAFISKAMIFTIGMLSRVGFLSARLLEFTAPPPLKSNAMAQLLILVDERRGSSDGSYRQANNPETGFE